MPPDIQTVRAAALLLSTKRQLPRLVSILNDEFGARKISEIPEEKRMQFISRVLLEKQKGPLAMWSMTQ